MKELEEIKVQFLGKKGELSQFMKQLKELSNEKKSGNRKECQSAQGPFSGEN